MQYMSQAVKIQKIFILQEQVSNKTKVIPYGICCYKDQVDLFPLLSCSLQQLKGVQIKIYDFKQNKYVNIQTLGIRFHVPSSYLDSGNNVVLIKYHYSQCQTMSMSSFNSSVKFDTQSKKNQRSKERIILEVIQIVKKWRRLCENKRGQTLTLAEAAEKVGLPKKSLDDYYYQLRMGEKYGFDYHQHILQRIGVLRSFLKKFKTHRKGDKNQKLPNILKVADQIDKYQNMIKQGSQPEMHSENSEIQEQNEENQQKIQVKKQNIEKEFYDQFNYNFGKQMDPFLSLGQSNQNSQMMNEDSGYQKEFEMFF